jgi:uncharacterized FAD-dependent dehydrogenase
MRSCSGFTVFKRAYDARKKTAIVLIYTVDCDGGRRGRRAAALCRRPASAQPRHALPLHRPGAGRLPPPAGRPPRPVVVGFGPCGLFAALMLAQMGLRPLVLERGKAVRERTKDTWGLWRQGVLDPESNVQFGEGGAGTFSTASSGARSATRATSRARC